MDGQPSSFGAQTTHGICQHLARGVGFEGLIEEAVGVLAPLHRPQHFAQMGGNLGVRADVIGALELSPDDPFILDSMGWVRFRRGDVPAALKYLERAYAIRADAEIAAHLGEVLWSVERREDANRLFDEALKAHPSSKVLADTVRRLRAE